MNFKTIAMAAGLLLTCTASFAQEDRNPHWYVGAQGGVQVQPLSGNLKDLYTPHFGIQIGNQISDVFGMRLQGLGYQAKGQFSDVAVQGLPGSIKEYKVWSAKWDLLFNITNIISPNRTNKSFNWSIFLGAGATGAWDTPKYSNNFALYPGGGTQIEYLVSKNVGINLELQANHKAMSLNDINRGDKWQGVALLGLTYHFNGKKKPAPEPVVEVAPEPEYATRIDTIWYNETEYRTKTVTDQFSTGAKFKIRETSNVDESVVSKVVKFVKENNNVKVSVTGYADKGTGKPESNMKYSQKRAESTAAALIEAGVPAEIITVDWKGDTEQPFEVNEDNRTAIVKVSGEAQEKEPVTVKKFRTETVRYQVK